MQGFARQSFVIFLSTSVLAGSLLSACGSSTQTEAELSSPTPVDFQIASPDNTDFLASLGFMMPLVCSPEAFVEDQSDTDPCAAYQELLLNLAIEVEQVPRLRDALVRLLQPGMNLATRERWIGHAIDVSPLDLSDEETEPLP